MAELQPHSQARANKLEQRVLWPKSHSTMPDSESYQILRPGLQKKSPFPKPDELGYHRELQLRQAHQAEKPGHRSQAAFTTPSAALSPKVTQQEPREDFQLI